MPQRDFLHQDGLTATAMRQYHLAALQTSLPAGSEQYPLLRFLLVQSLQLYVTLTQYDPIHRAFTVGTNMHLSDVVLGTLNQDRTIWLLRGIGLWMMGHTMIREKG